jgi:hypothetical protein
MSFLMKKWSSFMYVPIIVLNFYCLNKSFYWSQNFCKFSAFSLEFQNLFSITKTIFLTVGQNNFGNKIPFSGQIAICSSRFSHSLFFLLAWEKSVSFITLDTYHNWLYNFVTVLEGHGWLVGLDALFA